MKPGTKFLNSLFEVAHVEFQTYDISSRKLLFSSGVARHLLGYTEGEYVKFSNNYYKEIIHPEDFSKTLEVFKQLIDLKEGEIIETTVRMRTVDGSYIWLYSRQMIYERDLKKQVSTIIREVEDVTKLVLLQSELDEKLKRLQAISFKNSHLLRSPVASIIGLVNLIEENANLGEHNRQILYFLKETIAKLDNVIHEINNDTEFE